MLSVGPDKCCIRTRSPLKCIKCSLTAVALLEITFSYMYLTHMQGSWSKFFCSRRLLTVNRLFFSQVSVWEIETCVAALGLGGPSLFNWVFILLHCHFTLTAQSKRIYQYHMDSKKKLSETSTFKYSLFISYICNYLYRRFTGNQILENDWKFDSSYLFTIYDLVLCGSQHKAFVIDDILVLFAFWTLKVCKHFCEEVCNTNRVFEIVRNKYIYFWLIFCLDVLTSITQMYPTINWQKLSQGSFTCVYKW